MSGLPSALFGAGAERLGLPSGRRGMPVIGWRHCAAAGITLIIKVAIVKRTFIVILLWFVASHYNGIPPNGWENANETLDVQSGSGRDVARHCERRLADAGTTDGAGHDSVQREDHHG